ncbi:MAG: type II toxin-antitoxin system HicB family antitoxin, partial [Ktedonobacteraceae bacterium]
GMRVETMKNGTYTVDIRRVNGRFEVSIPELGEGIQATGATHDEALENAERVIMAALMAAANQPKQKTA